MHKKNLLISAALTAFILVILTGVVSAYRQVNEAQVALQPTPAVQQAAVIIPTETVEIVPVVLTHQEAAMIAANYLGNTDIYSVENTIWNNVDAFKVVFSSGDIVYVSMDGQILGTEAPQTVVVTNNNGGGGRGASGSHRESEEHEEHEEHDD